MSKEQTIAVIIDKISPTKKGDKLALSYKEVNIQTHYLDIEKFGTQFEAGDRVLLTVQEVQNQDKTTRFIVSKIEVI